MFKNEDFKIAYNHLEKSIKESEEATKKIIENINNSLKIAKSLGNQNLKRYLENSLVLLEFQDIIAQRVKKVEDFLKKVDKIVDTKDLKENLKEFAWERETTQEDVDEILKRHGL